MELNCLTLALSYLEFNERYSSRAVSKQFLSILLEDGTCSSIYLLTNLTPRVLHITWTDYTIFMQRNDLSQLKQLFLYATSSDEIKVDLPRLKALTVMMVENY